MINTRRHTQYLFQVRKSSLTFKKQQENNSLQITGISSWCDVKVRDAAVQLSNINLWCSQFLSRIFSSPSCSIRHTRKNNRNSSVSILACQAHSLHTGCPTTTNNFLHFSFLGFFDLNKEFSRFYEVANKRCTSTTLVILQ